MALSIRYYGRMSFFDRSVIRRNWKNINRGPLQKAGNIVRMNARQSIRRRKNRNLHSSPGQPPFSHREGSVPPFKMIYSVPDMAGTAVTIGMVWFGSWPPVPGLHELGGTATRTVKDQVIGFRGGSKHIPIWSFQKRKVRYPKRPFMGPALDKAFREGKIPSLWRYSVSRAA
jgi:hypothetical protein